MRRVYADTVYWIALANPLDQWHALAVQAGRTLRGAKIITSEEILTEFLAHFSGRGRTTREGAARHADRVLSNPGISVRPQTHQSFFDGFALFKARPDKEYSLTDCISMRVMRAGGVVEILTHDVHFAQEGFTLLM